MYNIMIYLENEAIKDCLNLIQAADIIGSKHKDYKIYGVGVNVDIDKCNGQFDYIINIEDKISKFDIKSISKYIENIDDEYRFDAILINANDTGRMIGPRIAMALNTGIVADVTDIKMEDESIMMVRPAFDGKIMAAISFEENKTIISSIRSGIFKNDNKSYKETKIINFKSNLDNKSKLDKLKVIKSIKKSSSDDIRDSNFLISFGGGVNSNLDEVYELAKLCEAKVSASRRAVDSGYANRSIQVGQSGKTVSPKVYIALGIYGSIQHIEGLKNVDTIISVNTDINAAICSLSDITVNSDAIEFVKNLRKKIEDEKNKDKDIQK